MLYNIDIISVIMRIILYIVEASMHFIEREHTHE
jgi:hypothetical protein